jgi:hypothetical protein
VKQFLHNLSVLFDLLADGIKLLHQILSQKENNSFAAKKCNVIVQAYA